MSEYGAMLQNYNQDLVKYIEQLKSKRQKISESIEKDVQEKLQVQTKIEEMTGQLSKINEGIAKKMRMRDEVDGTLEEANLGMKKILESSELILNVVKRSSNNNKKRRDSGFDPNTGRKLIASDKNSETLIFRRENNNYN